MNLEDFEIGCIIRHPKWTDDYTVLRFSGNTDEIYIENNTTHERLWWSGYKYLVLEINGIVSGKTPIERKIAHLYKLFEERKMK